MQAIIQTKTLSTETSFPRWMEGVKQSIERMTDGRLSADNFKADFYSLFCEYYAPWAAAAKILGEDDLDG